MGSWVPRGRKVKQVPRALMGQQATEVRQARQGIKARGAQWDQKDPLARQECLVKQALLASWARKAHEDTEAHVARRGQQVHEGSLETKASECLAHLVRPESKGSKASKVSEGAQDHLARQAAMGSLAGMASTGRMVAMARMAPTGQEVPQARPVSKAIPVIKSKTSFKST